MKPCDSHYPVMGNWDIIKDTPEITIWQCPKCKEIMSGKPHRGKLDLVPDRIKEDRKKHFKDTLQPHREGVPSKEFIDAYPQQAKQIFTPTEIKRAKNVWKD